jgi:8-oxo-dGTP diphosphatase
MRYRVDSRRRRPKPKTQAREVSNTSRRRVVSAGGVVLRLVEGSLEVLLIAIKEGRVWSLPKGQVEIGERYPQTALREVKEETGIEARILASLGSIRYHFTVKDDATPTIVTKEVHHFLMGYEAGTPRPQKEEVDEVEWVPVSEALRRLVHQNERDTLIRGLARWEDKREGKGMSRVLR